MANSSEGEE